MHETPDDLAALQDLLDRSYALAGPHMRRIITPECPRDPRSWMFWTASSERLLPRVLPFGAMHTVALARAGGRPIKPVR